MCVLQVHSSPKCVVLQVGICFRCVVHMCTCYKCACFSCVLKEDAVLQLCLPGV